MTKKTKLFVLGLLCVFYLSMHLLKVQFTPFFIFGMYSKKVENQDFYQAYEIEADGELIYPLDLGKDQAELVMGPLTYYLDHLKYDGDDPVERFVLSKRPHWEGNGLYNKVSSHVFTNKKKLEKFPDWFKSIMESILNSEIDQLIIYSTKVKYIDFGIETVSRNKVLTIE